MSCFTIFMQKSFIMVMSSRDSLLMISRYLDTHLLVQRRLPPAPWHRGAPLPAHIYSKSWCDKNMDNIKDARISFQFSSYKPIYSSCNWLLALVYMRSLLFVMYLWQLQEYIFPSLFLSDFMFTSCPDICHFLSLDPLTVAHSMAPKKKKKKK